MNDDLQALISELEYIIELNEDGDTTQAIEELQNQTGTIATILTEAGH